jgi:cytochrome P450
MDALFGPEMLADPYPFFARLRAEDPVHWHEPLGAWLLTRYDAVEAALRDPRLSSDFRDLCPGGGAAGSQDVQGLYAFVANSMVFSDPPRHTRLRALASKAFTPHAVEAMTGHIQGLVDGILGRVQGQGRMDVIADLAFPLPLTVIAGMLGVDLKDLGRVKQWCDDFLVPFGREPARLGPDERQRAREAGEGLAGYVKGMVERARSAPGDDLLGALVRAEEQGDRLSEEELFANAVLLMIAGHENTTNLIGNGTLALLRHPDQMRRLRDDPSLAPQAVEELLRFDSPNQFIRRRATEDLTAGGKAVRKGQVLLLFLAAANRDPAHFPDPDRLDLTRDPNRHLAFGHGPHYCLGSPLARLEAQVAFRTMLRRLPDLRLEADGVAYHDNFNERGLKSLPVAFSPAG